MVDKHLDINIISFPNNSSLLAQDSSATQKLKQKKNMENVKTIENNFTVLP